jgi:hypothetical protein
VGQKAREVENTNFWVRYLGSASTRNDVGVLIDENLKDGVVDDLKKEGYNHLSQARCWKSCLEY